MKSSYKKLGDYIQLVDERNKDLAVDLLLGVSIEKRFIPSIANTVGTDFSNYKVVHKNQFAYGPVTSRNGDKISVALLKEEICIISSSYSVFEIIDKEALNPEYLMLWFNRPEFDRYARFKSHGSAREIFDWDEMCNVELPVPAIEKQREIVWQYQTITNRIKLLEKINDNLEQQAISIYSELILNNQEDNTSGLLSDIAKIDMGQSPSGSSYNENGNGEVFFQGRTDFGNRFPSRRLFTTEPKKMAEVGDLLLSVRAPVGDINIATEKCCIGRGLASIKSKNKMTSFLLYTMLNSKKRLDVFNNEGTVFGAVNKKALNNLKILIPTPNIISRFEELVSPIDQYILNNDMESLRLKKLRDSIFPRLLSGKIEQ